ncbi:MAG: glycosyltransferase family 9 protein [Actinomycetota bacterium]|nr:glycosyltransferase family 9 protein [Actinomycetota bacterium]
MENTQSLLGDRLMFTPAVRDLKAARPNWRIGIVSGCPEIWENNPHIDPEVTRATADEIFNIGPGQVTRGSKTNGLHCMQSFFESLTDQLIERGLVDVKFRGGLIRPDIHLSPAEKQERIVDGSYWVINTDTGPFSAKRWPADYFQQLVESLFPMVTFVQVGLSQNNYRRLHGSNVIDLIDRTKIRELFSLVYNAAGCVSLVSSLMHVAGAFQKPCVVIAGGREPDTFERYPNHRFLDNVGALPCCRDFACWHNSLDACEDHDGQHAACMTTIPPARVREAALSYYSAGVLPSPDSDSVATGLPAAKLRPLLRIVASTKCLGGAERSVVEISRMFVEKNWRVELTTPTNHPSPEVLGELPAEVKLNQHVTKPCDVLLFYASDLVFGFDELRFEPFERLDAKRKVMALTYKIGKAPSEPWAQGWDQYLFLSSALERGFLDKLDGREAKTAVLAPPVDLDPFLAVRPDYSKQTTIARHSSQGAVKFSGDLWGLVDTLQDTRFEFMPEPPGFGEPSRRNCGCVPYNPDRAAVAAFLSKSNCFWYLLPDGYTDQGPRVIVEAMAAGLPAIAENRDGAADRVTDETGWLLDGHDEAVDLIWGLTPEILAAKGAAARERAKNTFDKWKWFEIICGG